MTVEDDIRRLLDVGLTHYGLGEVDRAEEAWRQVLALDPTNPRAQEYLRFVTENWAPNQTRQGEPYRPDEGSDGTGQRNVKAQAPAGASPVPVAAEPVASPGVEVEPDPPPAVVPTPPDVGPAPTAGVVTPSSAHPSQSTQPAFVPPAKVPVKATFWGDLYNFEASAPVNAPVELPSVFPAPQKPADPLPGPSAAQSEIVAASLFEETNEQPETPAPVVLENSPSIEPPQVEPDGEWEDVSPATPPAEPEVVYTDGFDAGQTRQYQQVPTVLFSGVTQMAAAVESAMASGVEPASEPEEPRRVTSTLPPPPVLQALQPAVAPPMPVSEPPAPAVAPPAPIAVAPPPPAVEPPPPAPSAESGWSAPVWQSAPPPPLAIHPRPPFGSDQSSSGWRSSESSALDLVGEAPSAQPGPVASAAPADGRESILRGARDLLELDDFSGALELLDRLLEQTPDHQEASKLRASAEAQLLRIFRSKVGDLGRVPRVRMPGDEIIWLNLDHRAGFVLSLVDGNMSLDDILTISGLSELESLRILAQLLGERVIEVD